MKWRVSVRKDRSTKYCDYFTIEAETADEAKQIALGKKNVRCVNWVESVEDRNRWAGK